MNRNIQADKAFLKWSEKTSKNVVHIADAWYAAVKWADEHPQNPQLSAADRGVIDEIIFVLNSLGKEKMISYYKEIEFLNKIRNL